MAEVGDGEKAKGLRCGASERWASICVFLAAAKSDAMIPADPRKKANGDELMSRNLIGSNVGTRPVQERLKTSIGSKSRFASSPSADHPRWARRDRPYFSESLRVSIRNFLGAQD